MFRSLYEALRNAQDVIVAEDISDDGKKVFYTGDIESLDQRYTNTEQKHWHGKSLQASFFSVMLVVLGLLLVMLQPLCYGSVDRLLLEISSLT